MNNLTNNLMENLKDKIALKQAKIAVAKGDAMAELVFKNAKILNVFTEEVEIGDVAIYQGEIVGVGQYNGAVEVDCTGKFLAPAFIDGHVHIESSMVLPQTFAQTIMPTGTTTIIADPHELINVCGAKGMEFFLDCARKTPLDIRYMLPSSVPATAFETNGSDFTAADMLTFLSDENVGGLGEVMCYPNVIFGDPVILEKIAMMENCGDSGLDFSKSKMQVDGHAPALSGGDLQAYVVAGVATEHECTTFAEAKERLAAGMKILVREGSAAHNLEAIISGFVEANLPLDNLMFCTDDKHLEHINQRGHICENVRLAIALGVPVAKAYKMAAYNTAQTYNLHGVGAVAAGYVADLLILNDLEKVEICDVYKNGVSVANLEFTPTAVPREILNSVHLPEIKVENLQLTVGEKCHVLGIVSGQILTKHLLEAVPNIDGKFMANGEYNKLCVVERHGKNGNLAVCPLKNFGIKGGAIATTVAHDSHNIIVAGDNDGDILLALETLAEIQGGYVLVQNGEVHVLPLQVAGLMSQQSAQEVIEQSHKMLNLAYEMGIDAGSDPFITLSFLALPVIPELRLTDQGLFDVVNFKLL